MKNKKVSRIFSEGRTNSIILAFLGLVLVVIGVLYFFEIIQSEKNNSLLFIGVGAACILFSIVKFIMEGKYKNCLLYNISKEWDEDELAEKISSYEFCSNAYAEYFSDRIIVYVEIGINTFEAHISKEKVEMYIDYTESYIHSLPEGSNIELKDYSKYEEECDSLNMSKEEFVTKFTSFVIKNRDFL